jgi:hypothetical protein
VEAAGSVACNQLGASAEGRYLMISANAFLPITEIINLSLSAILLGVGKADGKTLSV